MSAYTLVTVGDSQNMLESLALHSHAAARHVQDADKSS